MKKITEIKVFMATKHLLTQCQMQNTKGGIDVILVDDKRRPRPGGGASTQVVI